MTYWEFLHWLVQNDYIEEASVELRSMQWDEAAILCWIRGVLERPA